MPIPIPDAAIGGIVAALVAGSGAVLTLIITKESKISEFRQQWIDSLRSDVSEYLSRIHSIENVYDLEGISEKDRHELTDAAYVAANLAAFNIRLRLNANEEPSRKLLEAVDEIEAHANTKKDRGRLAALEKALLQRARHVLAEEWARVKHGEPAYVWAKRIGLIAAAVMIAILSWLFLAAI